MIFLDINASKEKRSISLDLVRKISDEAYMPFSIGGGINNLEQISSILNLGAERVVISTAIWEKPNFIKEASKAFGSSTISVCMDIKKSLFRSEQVWYLNAQKPTKINPVIFAKKMEEDGVGELIIQSVDLDGIMEGYNLELLDKISNSVSIPITALGGAGNLMHMREAYKKINLNGLASGSSFIYHGKEKGILINYPNKQDILQNFIK